MKRVAPGVWLSVLFVVAAGVRPPAVCRAQPAAARIPPRMVFVDNGKVRLGIDLNRGGSITYLADAKRRDNLVNFMDLGREIQQSYYSGPRPYKRSTVRAFEGWAWNPVQAGDVHGNASRVVSHKSDKDSLYVQTVPMQWALRREPAECTMETWVRLEENTARVRCRLTNRRGDRKNYGPHVQELPAVYTVGKLHRLHTYDGDAPFTGAALREIRKVTEKSTGEPFLKKDPWTIWKATENWAALTTDDGWGLGVFHPGVYRFGGGFWGRPNTGGATDDPTGYLSPQRLEVLDHNIVYEYEYALILGRLKEIRDYVYAHKPDPRPDFHFKKGREHWHMVNAADGGFPWKGAWDVALEDREPFLVSPDLFFRAADVPELVIRATHHTSGKLARLCWETTTGKDFVAERCVTFPVTPDGKAHDYRVRLAGHRNWEGVITRLRFDPVTQGKSGERVEVHSLSWRAP